MFQGWSRGSVWTCGCILINDPLYFNVRSVHFEDTLSTFCPFLWHFQWQPMTVEFLSKSDVVKFKKIHFMRNFVNNDDNEIALWCGRPCRNIVFHLGNNFPSGTNFQLILLRDHPFRNQRFFFLTLLTIFSVYQP